MIDKVGQSKCCLCGNCIEICPTQAISFEKKYHTFQYPTIDLSKCICCDACERVCPLLVPLKQGDSIASYEARNKDCEVTLNSSSGGVFSALATWFYANGGIVVGASFNKDWSVSHIITRNQEELSLLRGSKYVQSNMSGCFRQIKEMLERNQKVLFSGCPCQCAALRCYLGNQYSTLYVVDFICHGMLSSELFQSYLADMEKKNKVPIKSFVFRDKTNGWADSGPKVVFENGKTKTWPLYEDLYMQGYFRNLCMKEVCYTCPFKNFHSGSDLTLGDFWGAEILDSDFYDASGVSLISVQTDAGKELLAFVKDSLVFKEQPLTLLTKYNQGMYQPFAKGKDSERFWQLAETIGPIASLRKISKLTSMERIKRIYHHLKYKIK